MAKIPDYPEKTTIANEDQFVIEDVAAGNTKYVTRENLLASAPMPGGTAFVNGAGVYGGPEYFTTSGSWTKPANLKFVIVEVQGGGGGGGGASATGSGQFAIGVGGAGGAYCRKKILAADLAASETVTVGVGGTAGAAPGNGGTGGTSSFGTHCSADGGGGGNNGGNAAANEAGLLLVGLSGASIPTATGGDINVNGGQGAFSAGGAAGGSYGGASRIGGSLGNGFPGLVYGGGGSAGVNRDPSIGTARSGGAGAAGIVIVHEYF